MRLVRLGAVNYLNARPLVYGLEMRSDLFSVRFDVPSTCAALLHEAFPVVLAADVLYERRDMEPLLALTEQVVAPGGELWLSEPNRVPALLVVETLKTRGWTCDTERCDGPWPDPEDNHKGIVVSSLVPLVYSYVLWRREGGR